MGRNPPSKKRFLLRINFSKIFLSFLIVAFGTPSLSPALSIAASSFGYALFWYGERRFWLSSLWFASVQAVQISWLSKTTYMGPFILIVYLFLCVAMGLQFGLLTRVVRLPLRLKQIAALAGFWVLMEWIRLFFLTGFTWNPIGLSLASNNYSIQFASLFGIYGLCFWVIWVNLFALRAILEKKWLAWALFALIPYFYGAFQKFAIEPKTLSVLNVALVQTGLLPEQRDRQKSSPNAYIPPLLQWDRILTHLQNTRGREFDLIVFPEGALPGGAKKGRYSLEAATALWESHFGPGSKLDFPPFEKKVTNSFLVQSLANHYRAEVIIGLDDVEDNKVYNTALHFTSGNLPIERYQKQILIPGGEYIPLSQWKWLVDFFAEKFGVEGTFHSGKRSQVFSGKTPVGIAICLEETHSRLFREIRQNGAELFVSISNDVWFPKTRLPWHHFDHGRIRAAENGTSLLRACNTGVTAAVDCFGASVKIFPASEEAAGALSLTFPVSSYKTLYTFLGDIPILLASGVFVLIALPKKKKKLL